MSNPIHYPILANIQFNYLYNGQATTTKFDNDSIGSTHKSLEADLFQPTMTKPLQFGSKLSRFTELPEVPQERRNIPVDEFSDPFIGSSPFLELRQVSGKNPFYFANRPNAPEGAVHSLVIIRDDDAQKTPYIVMNITNATVFGGQPKLMLLAGILDKKVKPLSKEPQER